MALSSGSHPARDNQAMRILVVEDELKDGQPPPPRPSSRRGTPSTSRTGDDALRIRAARGVRRDRARPDAARRRRRGLPAAARDRRVGARADAHRARRRRGPWPASTRAPTTTCRSRSPLPSCSRDCARSSAAARSSGRRCSKSACSDPATRQAWRGDAEIGLSAKEFALLETFMRRPGLRPLAGRAAEARVGLRVREPLERRRRLRPYLREKIDRPAGRASLETVRGRGYRLRREVT